MATSRIFYGNYLTDLNPTISLFASGGAVAQSNATITAPIPYKTGWATMTTAGAYTDLVPRVYRVEIHVSGAFGTALWRWSDAGGVAPIVWNAQNLTTVSGVHVPLNHGVQVRFDQVGTGTPQFELGDTWLFLGTLKHGVEQAVDDRRDTEWRTGALPAGSAVEYRVDFGFAVSPTAFILMDQNLPSTATIALKSKSTDFTDPPDVTIPVAWNADRLLALLSTTARRYWRVCITLGATALPYMRWSEIFLGPSVVFDRNFVHGYTREQRRVGAVSVETLQRGPGPLLLTGDHLQLTYASMSAADRARLRTVWEWQHDRVHQVQRPFYVLPLDSHLSDFSLYSWVNDYVEDHQFNELSDSPVEWAEQIRSVA
jgi:hypothetical protein